MRTGDHHIRWSAATADADAVLTSQLAGLGLGAARTGRLCPRCGASGHGRPWARAGDVEIPVSISRSGPHLVTVVGGTGVTALGVDVEDVQPGPGGWPLDTMLAPGEQLSGGPYAEARLWAAKEAVLKADGTGLDRAMVDVLVAAFDGEVTEVAAPPGYVAALALRR
ncbi:MAG: hypothetical protein JWQ74_1642 [Marmoricola sp.]|nr:hypothetical protein [Marmoricola sp.]